LRRVRERSNKPSSLASCSFAPERYQVLPSLFLPAKARQLFHELICKVTFHIVVTLPPKPQRLHLLAEDVADRQRRRKTWKQNQERYALPEGALSDLKIEAGEQLAKLLPEEYLNCRRCSKLEVSEGLSTWYFLGLAEPERVGLWQCSLCEVVLLALLGDLPTPFHDKFQNSRRRGQ